MLAVSGRLDRTPFGPPVPVHLTPFLDGRGRPAASGPLDGDGRRQRLPRGAPELPVAVPAGLRHADPVLDRRPPAGVERPGPGADPDERPVRPRSRPSVWAKRVLRGAGRSPERVRRMYLTRVRPAADGRRVGRVPGRSSIEQADRHGHGRTMMRSVVGRPGAHAVQREGVHLPRTDATAKHAMPHVFAPRRPAARCSPAPRTASAPSRSPRCSPRTAGAPAGSRSGTTRRRRRRHLPLHGRRAVAGRHVRPQAAAREVPRQGPALGLQGRADAVQQRRQRAGLAVEVPAARPERACRSASCSRTSPKCVDDLAVVRSMVSKFPEHTSANYFLHTGTGVQGRPSMGAWVGYGLGSENQDLPGVRRPQRRADPAGRARQLQQRLPAGRVPGLGLPRRRPAGRQRRAARADRRPPARQARPARASSTQASASGSAGPTRSNRRSPTTSWPSACRRPCPELMDLNGETEATRQLYGLDATYPQTQTFGRQCLLARRLVERGVRFIELTCPHVGGDRWDQHSRPEERPREQRPRRRPADRRPADRPEGARPARRRRWSSGPASSAARRSPRAPTAATTTRSASPSGWPAAASRAAIVYGATDECGYKVVQGQASRSTTCTRRCCTCSASTTRG